MILRPETQKGKYFAALKNKALETFGTLQGAPRELWFIYLLKFLESYSYFSMSVVITIFLSKEFDLSDTEAGVAYGVMGSLTSIYGLVVGFSIDRMGVRKSLFFGIVITIFSRATMTVTDSVFVLYGMIFLGLPLGGCLTIPVMTLAIRRYTTGANRGFAFGLFYSVMNVGALISGFVVDGLSLALGDNEYLGLTAHRWVFATGTICSIVMLVLVLAFIRDVKVADESGAAPETPPQSGVWLKSVREIWALRSFWRFLALTLITVNLRSIFRHLDASLPKYMIREFGPDVAKGSIYSINPLVIIFLVPIVAAVTQKRENFDVIHVGAYLTAASVFILATWTSVEACVLFVVVLSFGEALWSPRFYDYTVSVAPEGREGMFLALSSAPLFFATMPVGVLSGYLLQKYCPETGPRDSKRMWLIIGILTLSSPILITLTERWIREPKAKVKSLKDSVPALTFSPHFHTRVSRPPERCTHTH